ncbi:MAG: hypothetical protein R3C62_04755 [Chloroflexota bacterium]
MSDIRNEDFVNGLLNVLSETMVGVQGFYLDGGDSLFETLATVTAAEASVPVGGKCATLAAQVKHTAFYLHVIDQSVRNPDFPRPDWGEIWRTVNTVTPDEWAAIQAELRLRYDEIIQLVKDTPAWGEAEMGGAIGMVAHCAYHLGEIRQALCSLK